MFGQNECEVLRIRVNFMELYFPVGLTGSFIISMLLLQRTITTFFLLSESCFDLITMLLMVIIEISLRSFITQENGDDRLAFLCETDMGDRQCKCQEHGQKL